MEWAPLEDLIGASNYDRTIRSEIDSLLLGRTATTYRLQQRRPGKCVGRRQAADALKGGGVQQMRRRAPKGGVGCSAPGCLRAATRPEEGSRLWACLDGR
uniref:Uncharacterized protein n=1 Tax=Oryza meridionalis TaxID=40149 RepID=A0A0E0C3L8_9ORYZ